MDDSNRKRLSARLTDASTGRRTSPEAVLRERARQLAKRLPIPETGELLEVVQFRLGREYLACEAAWVQEVFPLRGMVPVPGTPPFIAGVVNHRGVIVSVVDLGKFLGFSPAPAEEAGVVLYLEDDDIDFGILAAGVEAATQVPQRALAGTPPTLPEAMARYLLGMLPGTVPLIDARLLLADPLLRIG